MKNIHVLKTDKPSRLVLDSINNNLFLTTTKSFPSDIMKFKNIYITSDEEIENCWFVNLTNNEIGYIKNNIGTQKNAKKIILTTDIDLIKDGVQAIDYEFLEWFVKNPSCEEVKVEITEISCIIPNFGDVDKYKIIIPKEKPKQETLEEVAEKYSSIAFSGRQDLYDGFIAGAKWQAERMYSEEDMREAFENGVGSGKYQAEYGNNAKGSMNFEYFIEQFKKK